MNEDVSLIQRLIKPGCNVSSGAPIDFYDQTFTGVNAFHIAILKKNPQIVASMLQADDINTAMTMKCEEKNKKYWSPLQLAVKIAKEANDKNSILVCILNIVYILIPISSIF